MRRRAVERFPTPIRCLTINRVTKLAFPSWVLRSHVVLIEHFPTMGARSCPGQSRRMHEVSQSDPQNLRIVIAGCPATPSFNLPAGGSASIATTRVLSRFTS